MSRSTIKDPAKSKSSETFFKVLRFIGRYRFLLILSIILAAVSVILQLYVPILFGNAIDQVIAQHQVNFEMMWYYLSRILVMVILSSAATWLMNVINNRMTYQTVKDIRAKAIRHIQVLPLSYLDGHSTGDIISRIIADTDILSDGMLLGFTQLFSGIVTIIGTLIFMFSKNFWITLMVIVLTPVSFLVAKFISSHTFQMFRKQSDARGRQTALIEEMIGNQKVVQAFGYEEKSSERFAKINEELQECSLKAVFYSSLTNPSTRFVNNIIYACVALVGAFIIPGGRLTVGGLSVLLSYANQYMKPFNDISSVVTELQNALACAGRIFDLLEEEPEVAEASETLKNVKGEVDIKSVCFHYDESKKLIENFNLHVKPGMRVAIVGPTGCGKTYLVKTLAKLLDVPLAIADATSLTEAGYIGDDIESVVSKLLAAADNDVERAEHGIIFIDEIDKIAKKKNTNQRDVSGEAVQQGMLKLLEGSEVEVPVGANSKNAMVPLVTVNTRNILFICGGAFPDLENIIKERLNKQASIGFYADLKDKYDNDPHILQKVTVEDIRNFGMIPEFIGRLPIIFTLDGLNEDMLVKILQEPKNAILKQYQKLLALDEVKLEFEDGALHAIAAKALERDTGARALRAILEEYMLDIMYEIPKDDSIGEVVITREYIEGNGGPKILLRGQEPILLEGSH